MQSLGATLSEPAVVWAGDGANGVLEEGETGMEFGVMGWEDEGTHYDVGVAVDVFGEGV